MRTVTIKTDESLTSAASSRPGDRINIVLTRNTSRSMKPRRTPKAPAGSTIATEIVGSTPRCSRSAEQGADEGRTKPAGGKLRDAQSERLGSRRGSLARNIGTLSLQLHASGGEGSSAKEGLTTISAFWGSGL